MMAEKGEKQIKFNKNFSIFQIIILSVFMILSQIEIITSYLSKLIQNNPFLNILPLSAIFLTILIISFLDKNQEYPLESKVMIFVVFIIIYLYILMIANRYGVILFSILIIVPIFFYFIYRKAEQKKDLEKSISQPLKTKKITNKKKAEIGKTIILIFILFLPIVSIILLSYLFYNGLAQLDNLLIMLLANIFVIGLGVSILLEEKIIIYFYGKKYGRTSFDHDG